jgi:hypothetical protein
MRAAREGGAFFFQNRRSAVKQKAPGRIANAKVQRAIEAMVDYLATDERNNFMGEPDHIWHSVRIAMDWLGYDVDEFDPKYRFLKSEYRSRKSAAAEL